MPQTTAALAKAYYTAYHNKDLVTIKQLLHADVQFLGPMAQLQGKDAVLGSIERFLTVFKSLTVRTVFGSENQAMVVYDTEFPDPIGMFPSSALLTFKSGLITCLELFYDARPHEAKRAEIFSS